MVFNEKRLEENKQQAGATGNTASQLAPPGVLAQKDIMNGARDGKEVRGIYNRSYS